MAEDGAGSAVGLGRYTGPALDALPVTVAGTRLRVKFSVNRGLQRGSLLYWEFQVCMRLLPLESMFIDQAAPNAALGPPRLPPGTLKSAGSARPPADK